MPLLPLLPLLRSTAAVAPLLSLYSNQTDQCASTRHGEANLPPPLRAVASQVLAPDPSFHSPVAAPYPCPHTIMLININQRPCLEHVHVALT